MQSAVPTPSFPGLETSPVSSSSVMYNKSPSAPAATTTEHKRRRHIDGWYIPPLSLHLHDLSSPGCKKFLVAAAGDVEKVLTEAVVAVCKRLYGTPQRQPSSQTAISLHLRPMPGVAYTAGAHGEKQIHFSTDYVEGIAQERVREEVLGVLRHEMVHVWQHNGAGTCPGGLIEGVADWCRLRDGFVPPHWRRGGVEWDDGYQNTAYFLDWVEEEYGDGSVRWINKHLGENEYEDAMWTRLCGGKTIEELWCAYKECYGLSGAAKSTPKAEQEVAVNIVELTTITAAAENQEILTTTQEIPVYNAAPPPPPAADHDRSTVVIIDQPTSAVESLADSDSHSSYDPFPFRGEAAMVDIFATRLKNLTFDGTRDGKRFVKEFEGLIARVNPQMSEEDKRLLLVTALQGEKVNSWYEETDLDDELPYSVLVELLQRDWKGSSKRAAGLIDRDAKLC